MNILNIIQCTNLGGMEQANLVRLNGLKQLGHHCELISLNPLGALRPLLERHQIPARGLPYRGKGGWRSFGSMYRTFRDVRADAIIMTGHNLVGSVALGGLCRNRRLLALDFHHTGVKSPAQWRLIYRIARKQFRAVTFPTDFVRREAESLYPPIAEISHTLHDPVEIPHLPDESARRVARTVLGIPTDVPVIGNAGWLIPRKRFDVFLQTARRILDSSPDALFVIAGDGPEKQSLMRLADSLSLTGHVKWLGWQENLQQFYLSLDVLLFNSDWDALGRTPLEAIGLGVPVVASVVNGGLSEILDSEDYAFVASNHDLDWLARKVEIFAKDPQTGRAAALRARDHLMRTSAPIEHAQQMIALLSL